MSTQSANDGAKPEVYSPGEVASLELVWGDGYLSPGGAGAVARIVQGLNLSGKHVLDIGCGLGGPTCELVLTHGAARVTGIDINRGNIERAIKSEAAVRLNGRVRFQLVEAGPLPFADDSFDIVFSKDALVEAPDKAVLLAEAFRVLRPEGFLAASDWLRADGPVSPALQRWIDFSGAQEAGHAFHLASLAETRAALESLGYRAIEIASENAWYREEARRELKRKTDNFTRFVALRGETDAAQSLEWHKGMIAVLDRGDFHPSTFRAQKPSAGG